MSAFCALNASAQQVDSLEMLDELAELEAELDALFADEVDSASIMGLISQMMKTDTRYSELQVRLGYSSRVTSAGRDFGLDQQGVIPSVSFYHKSGLYGDLSGYWSSDLDPQYNITIATLGYLGSLSKKLNYTVSYDRSFFTRFDSLNTLTNSISTGLTYNEKYWYTGVDYSYSFGTETAHRLNWNLTGNFQFKGFGPIKRIASYPSVGLLFGNETIATQYTDVREIEIESTREFNVTLAERIIQRLEGRTNLTAEEQRRLENAQEVVANDGSLTRTITTDEEYTATDYSKVFSLLNYSFSLPIAFYTQNFTFLVSYNYNIPRNVSNVYDYEPNGYFGASVSWNFKIK